MRSLIGSGLRRMGGFWVINNGTTFATLSEAMGEFEQTHLSRCYGDDDCLLHVSVKVVESATSRDFAGQSWSFRVLGRADDAQGRG